MPLSFVIARYFAYAFVGVATAWLIAFMALSAAINMGFVYEASWGPANVREVAASLEQEGTRGPQDIPTAYQYLIVNAQGDTLMTDLAGTRLDHATEMANNVLAAKSGDVTIEGGGSGLTYAALPLVDGGACVLVSEYLPQWVSRDLIDVLPNPQNLMLVGAALGSALALALVARRASHVISRKMAPLTEAAERIGREELDFAVGRTNVREVNDVLGAMDTMRASLATSLEARWSAERTQREQVASLAHDLKTPLTVLRANADYLAEELGDSEASEALDRADLASAARDIADGAERLDAYVRLLIEASRGAAASAKEPVLPVELCEQIAKEAALVARAHNVELSTTIDPDLGSIPVVSFDRAALARAAANLISNAAEHAYAHMGLSCSVDKSSLIIEVADDGPGFSPAALEHGLERLFTDDSARSAQNGEHHYGLGLYTAAEAARAHGGTVSLANRPAGGAFATLTLPLNDN